jgi:hypothetical protein
MAQQVATNVAVAVLAPHLGKQTYVGDTAAGIARISNSVDLIAGIYLKAKMLVIQSRNLI